VLKSATARSPNKGVRASARNGCANAFLLLGATMSAERRNFLKKAGAAAVASLVPDAVRVGAWAAGSDAPEKKEVKVGFIPLTDCSSVVMAAVMEFDKKYGIKIVPSKEASWAAVRDKLVNGELDAGARSVWPHLRRADGARRAEEGHEHPDEPEPQRPAFTLSRKLYDKGVKDGASLKAHIDKEKASTRSRRRFRPARTRCGSTTGSRRTASTRSRTPRRSSFRRRRWSRTCASATWTASASASHGLSAPSWTRSAFTANTTQDLWKDHPEKTLGCTAEFAQKYPNTARAMTAAVIDAGRWIDASISNRQKTAEVVSDKSYVNCEKDVIVARMLGRYDNGIGKVWDDNGLHEVLQRRLRHLSVPVRRHVVHDAASPLGAAQGGARLPCDREESEPHRHLQGCGGGNEDAAAEGAVPHGEVHGRRRLGRQRREESTPARSRSGSPSERRPAAQGVLPAAPAHPSAAVLAGRADAAKGTRGRARIGDRLSPRSAHPEWLPAVLAPVAGLRSSSRCGRSSQSRAAGSPTRRRSSALR
jgi:nitrate/nitrite transport system substrate-binding protein